MKSHRLIAWGLSLFSFCYSLANQAQHEFEMNTSVQQSVVKSVQMDICTKLVLCHERLEKLIIDCLGKVIGAKLLESLGLANVFEIMEDPSMQPRLLHRIRNTLHKLKKEIKYSGSDIMPYNQGEDYSEEGLLVSIDVLTQELDAVSTFNEEVLQNKTFVLVSIEDDEQLEQIHTISQRFRKLFKAKKAKMAKVCEHLLDKINRNNAQTVLKLMVLDTTNLIQKMLDEKYANERSEEYALYEEHCRSVAENEQFSFGDRYREELNKTPILKEFDVFCAEQKITPEIFQDELNFDLNETLNESVFWENDITKQIAIVEIFLKILETGWLENVIAQEQQIFKRVFNEFEEQCSLKQQEAYEDDEGQLEGEEAVN